MRTGLFIVNIDAAAQRFIGWTANSTGNGFSIEGGMGYIINVATPKTVSFSGSAWQNTTLTAAAPMQPSIPQTWAFVLRAQLEGISGVKITVYNGRTKAAESSTTRKMVIRK